MYVAQDARLEPDARPHPKLGRFPASTPLGYVLLTAACLSQTPADRPTFEQVVQVLSDLQTELGSHYYTDLCGTTQSVERLAYRFDRGTLMDPELAMSSMSDRSILQMLGNNPYGRGTSDGSASTARGHERGAFSGGAESGRGSVPTSSAARSSEVLGRPPRPRSGDR